MVSKMQLYKYQEQAVDSLVGSKRMLIAGCLGKGTRILMSDGTYKNVEDIKQGDKVKSYDEYTGLFVDNDVKCMVMTSHKPKPMLSFIYDGEKITTTYDHPFYNGDGFYPLYQLIWGALETSQRAQLKLLCEQYGQDFDDKMVRGEKHSCCNETCARCVREYAHNDGWTHCKSPSYSGRKLARKPIESTVCESRRLQPREQQSGELGMVFSKIQHLVFIQGKENRESEEQEQLFINGRRQGICEAIFFKAHGKRFKLGKSRALRFSTKEVPKCEKRHAERVGKWSIKVETEQPYYSICLRQAPYTYCVGQKHNYITHNTGLGKGFMSLEWARRTGRYRVLVVTQASKRDAHDFESEAQQLNQEWYESLSSFEVVSWNGLEKWLKLHHNNLSDYAFIFDEIHRAKRGISSGMGRAFLKITNATHYWTGYTATPGENWLDFYAYFVACKFVRNKTEFVRRFCKVQTFKGFPEIVGYYDEDTLQKWWAAISYAPDTSIVENQLPPATHKVVNFKLPKGYKEVIKTRKDKDGELIETTMGLCHYLRRMCASKAKLEWLSDFIEGLGTNAVIFYNYIEEGDQIEQVVKKVLPKDAKVWRIDGKTHDIPNQSTIGKRDIVLAQWTSGSASINLQFISYWISFTPTYSYTVSIQGRGRIRRIGQSKPQFFYYLKTESGIEKSIYDCLANKKDFSERNWCIDNGISME